MAPVTPGTVGADNRHIGGLGLGQVGVEGVARIVAPAAGEQATNAALVNPSLILLAAQGDGDNVGQPMGAQSWWDAPEFLPTCSPDLNLKKML